MVPLLGDPVVLGLESLLVDLAVLSLDYQLESLLEALFLQRQVLPALAPLLVLDPSFPDFYQAPHLDQVQAQYRPLQSDQPLVLDYQQRLQVDHPQALDLQHQLHLDQLPNLHLVKLVRVWQ